jgi:hypothetical protein
MTSALVACHMLSPWINSRLILWNWRWRRYVLSKRRSTLNRLHGVICQEIELFEAYRNRISDCSVRAAKFIKANGLWHSDVKNRSISRSSQVDDGRQREEMLNMISGENKAKTMISLTASLPAVTWSSLRKAVLHTVFIFHNGKMMFMAIPIYEIQIWCC